MDKTYNPISTESTIESFEQYINLLDIPVIDYIAIGIQDSINRTSTSIMSNKEWQKHFANNQYANFDPLRQAVLSTKNNILLFNNIDSIDNYGAEIMNQRAKFGILDGFVVVERFKTYNIMITLATGYKKFNAFEYYCLNISSVKSIMNDLKKIIHSDSLKYF